MSLKIGVLGSSNGTDLDAIIDSIEKKYLDAEIKLITVSYTHLTLPTSDLV